MAIQPKIYAVNLTGSPINLTRLGLTVPASSSLELTITAYVEEIRDDESLYNAILAGSMVLSYGEGDWTKGESLKFFNVVSQEVRASVRVMSTTNLNPLSGVGQVLDTTVTVALNDRVLLVGQGTASENGIWVAKAGAWVRPQDFNTDDSACGAIAYVEEGTDHKEETWVCTAIKGSDVIGTNNLAWEQTSGSGATTLQEAYDAGNSIVTAGGVDIAFTLTSGDFTVDDGSVVFGGVTPLVDLSVDTGTMSLDSTDTTNITMSAASVGNKTLSIAATNSGGGDGLITIASTGTTSVDADGGIALESTAGNIDIGSDADDGDVNIGVGATAGRDITIGNKTGTTGVRIEATQTGQIVLDAPDTIIEGNLVVNGTTTTIHSEHVDVADNFLYLNADYTSVAGLAGGLVVNYQATATSDTVAAGGFTAGVPATSNPTVATTGPGPTFVAGDFVQVSGANNQANDGIYEVLNHLTPNLLKIRGIGLGGCTFSFTQNDFTTDATGGGTITKVNVAVIQVSSTGVWQVATGSNAGSLTFYDILTPNNVSLQVAYDGGQTIALVDTKGDLVITVDEDPTPANEANFKITGTTGDYFQTGQKSVVLGDPGLAIDVDVNGLTVEVVSAGLVSIAGAADSDFTVSGAGIDLTLQSQDGRVVIDGGEAASDAVRIVASDTAGGIDIDAGTGGITADTTGLVTITSTIAQAGAIQLYHNNAVGNIWIESVATQFNAVTIKANTGAGGIDVLTGTNGMNLTSTVAGATGAAAPILELTTTGAGGDTVGIFVGNANPDTVVPGPKGSLFLDGNNGIAYINTDGVKAWSAFATTTSTTLQVAYQNGNTIAVTAAEGPLAITLTSDDFTVNGANDVNFGGTTSLSTFNVDTTGAITVDSSGAGISLGAGGASDFTVTGAFDLTLESTLGRAIVQSGKAATDSIWINASGVAGGVTIDSGSEFVLMDGVRYYGKSAGAPAAATGGFQDGDKYYDTGLDLEMRYDAGRAKWLSIEAAYFEFGRNGATASPQYYRGPDGRIMSAAIGFYMPHNGAIVGLGYTRSDSDAATFDVMESGVSRATLASAAVAGVSNSLNANVSAGGILAVMNQTGGSVTSDVMAWVKVKWRS